ncbi:type I-F CRISPR-associated helicase Cas3f [Coxiella burnetii]|uniref:type I-F CRISPR-associated helicase Cas3f n=1 Tax=Coxiella burnetii TaxID=777 RepID=UPI0021556F16|nr:type I-F CRISPR-associated helicase Cas3f [Coxiella burnetii]
MLAAIAALFHDFGKASSAFQKKLEAEGKPLTDAFRHEWVSLRLFEAFVNGAEDDQHWLEKLANLTKDESSDIEKTCLEALLNDEISKPFKTLPPLAKVIGWLILTHHYLPLSRNSKRVTVTRKELEKILDYIDARCGYFEAKASEKEKTACWQFEKGLPFLSEHWREKASAWAKKALECALLKKINWLDDLFSLHLARLSLMLADHHYSSLPSCPQFGDSDFPLFANTDGKQKKQRLDEHLVGVCEQTRLIRTLPMLAQGLPRIARHKGFKRRTTHPRFRWQDRAYDLACVLRERTIEQGFFGINMASTGCGKTVANGRIMYGLSHPRQGARFSIALGLRVLTLQTGQVYRNCFHLGADDLAVLVGSVAVKELFEQSTKESRAARLGSESREALMPDDTYISFDGSLEVGPLKRWLEKKPDVKKLLAAPVLVSTVDHLIGATEATRGGKQIPPMLRFLTSDLVLDEVDDFDINDLPALTRLVHWAAMLGSRVLLSSATLPPALVEGLFNAYREGRAMFQKSRGTPGKAVNICCAWFDEHEVATSNHVVSKSFSEFHEKFVTKRIKKLRKAEASRRAVIKPLFITTKNPDEIRQQLADKLNEMIYELHERHYTADPQTGSRVSFGLIRFVNIDPLIDVAKHLLQKGARDNYCIKFYCYHSHHPLLIRNHIEKQLDRFLNRTMGDSEFFQQKIVKDTLSGCKAQNIIFLVLASPVAEIGRDHDYDWAIAEPSSMRSIVQLAGRVKRHRLGDCSVANVYLLETNVKSLEKGSGIATYCRPGFECKPFLLEKKYLDTILLPEQYEVITAIPRILANRDLKWGANLVDLGHARLEQVMLDRFNDKVTRPVNEWWETQAPLCGYMQCNQRFRNDPQGRERFALLWDEDEMKFKFYDLETEPWKNVTVRFEYINFECGKDIEPWSRSSYFEMLGEVASQRAMELEDCARRFGCVDLPKGKKWKYHELYGFTSSE